MKRFWLFFLLVLSGCEAYEDDSPQAYLGDVALSGHQAEEIFDYAYPLVLMQITQDLMFTVPFREASHPNKFIMFDELAKPKNQAVVLGNRNTLYCVGWLDLSQGPVIFEIPDMGDRYFVMPLLDAWTNTFASLGSRTTGQGAQKYIIALQGSEIAVPEGFTQINSPTAMVWITGRIQADSPADAKLAASLQKQYVLMTQQEAQTGHDPFIDYDPEFAAWQVRKPVPYSLQMDADDFYDTFFNARRKNQPLAGDTAILEVLGSIGVTQAEDLAFAQLPRQVQAQLEIALKNKQREYLAAFYRGKAQRTPWIFNLEQMGTWGNDYARRAYWAMWGLGANLVEDAVYGVSQLDSSLKQLTGDQVYKIHFAAEDLPPTSAFWSITTYDNEGYLEANELDRYSLGSNHELKFNPDGTLDIYLSNIKPDGALNWTPTPVAEFKVLLRIYWPDESVLEGRWTLPEIVKVSAG